MADLISFDYLEEQFNKLQNVKKVLEVGSYNVNGNSKEFIKKQGLEYLGVDLQSGPDVDLLCDFTASFDEVNEKLNQQRFDLIICMSVLEHVYEPKKVLDNIVKLLNDQGYILVITPIVWDLHDWPHDYCRLNPDYYKKFAEDNNLKILDGSFNFSVRNTRKVYDDIKNLPMIVPDLYKSGLRNILLRLLSKIVPELRQAWPHTCINLIYQKK